MILLTFAALTVCWEGSAAVLWHANISLQNHITMGMSTSLLTRYSILVRLMLKGNMLELGHLYCLVIQRSSARMSASMYANANEYEFGGIGTIP